MLAHSKRIMLIVSKESVVNRSMKLGPSIMVIEMKVITLYSSIILIETVACLSKQGYFEEGFIVDGNCPSIIDGTVASPSTVK